MSALAIKDPTRASSSWVCGEPPLQDLAAKLAHASVTITQADDHMMHEVVAAVHETINIPAIAEKLLAGAPDLARRQVQRVKSVFSGFDFHVTEDGPKLIEINTNAGGAFFGAMLDGASEHDGVWSFHSLDRWSDLFMDHFRNEWKLAGRGQLNTVAIVDDRPQEQFLRLEFHAAARMFHRAGINAVIAEPHELEHRNGRLYFRNRTIDLVYNRLTSFALDRPCDVALRQALLENSAVVTPDPRNHALLACKRNLEILSDQSYLNSQGLSARVLEILARAVPETIALNTGNAERLWNERDFKYFKPKSGFGSRAVYSGEKLTSKTWQNIVSSGIYVAQTKVVPPRVSLPSGDSLKYDVRKFTYGDKPFMTLARLYRGQTTNFRTPGGGFAPVRVRRD